jgi:hypothetical protein
MQENNQIVSPELGANIPATCADSPNQVQHRGSVGSAPGRSQLQGQGEPFNAALRQHQRRATAWQFSGQVSDLHRWARRMISEFKLDVGVPTLLIDPLRHRYGHYRCGRNGFGLIDEVAIDQRHLCRTQYWRVLGTQLHELLHAWQQHHGKPSLRNHHNGQFRAKARQLGLIIDRRGFTQYEPGETPFLRLLLRYGVRIDDPVDLGPAASHRILPLGPGSKLRLYMCGCPVRVRVAKSRFNARCLDCGELFQEQTAAPRDIGSE